LVFLNRMTKIRLLSIDKNICSKIRLDLGFVDSYIFGMVDKNRRTTYSWAGGLAWLRYRLDMAGVVGSNPTRPTKVQVLFVDSVYIADTISRCIIAKDFNS
jgi:hypothetical protein